MGAGESRVEYRPDPAQAAMMQQLLAQMSEQNKALASAVQKGEAAKEEAKKLASSVDGLKTELGSLEKRILEEREKHEKIIEKYMAEIQDKVKEMQKLEKDFEDINVNNLDELEEKEQIRFNKIKELCEKLPPVPLQGWNIGYFGNTSVGKSTLLNNTIGEKVCETGVGQTTLKLQPYRMANSDITIWDIPGKNDKISYLDATYIGIVKSMKFIGIVVTSTVYESSKIIELLKYLNLKYHIIVNKIDHIDEEELPAFKAGISKEINNDPDCLGVYYISAKHRSGDWATLINTLTNK